MTVPPLLRFSQVKSSGTTAAAENYRFADTQGRYVKITVNGNNVNDWANISELDVFSPTDTTPPAITGTNPEDGSINVEVNSIITASFSEQLSSSSVTTDTFTLSKPGSTSDIAGTVSLSSDGKTASFQPSADLAKSTTYVATLSIGVKDLAGNQLSQAKSWTFTTISDFIPPPPPSTCVNNLPVTAVSASGSQSPNIPSNVIDNNIATRWSNEGLGSWIQLDLGSQKTICSVDISWYNGNQRVNTFTIAVSNDGTTFTTVFSGRSTGASTAAEKYDVTDTQGRYVRITVNGNTQNNWASISEVGVFGDAGTTPPPPPPPPPNPSPDG